MHSALHNSYLLREVFQHLRIDQNLQACANGSLVCHLFRDPAQDVLWREIHCGTLPIFKLLPNLRVCEKDDVEFYMLDGPIMPTHLERLKTFGSRVHVLTCRERDDDPAFVDESLYLAVADALKGQPLFPNLEVLNWDLQVDDSSAFLKLCQSPNLRELDLGCFRAHKLDPSWTDDVSSFVQDLAGIKAPLVELFLDIPCKPALAESIASSFTRLHTLKFTLDPHMKPSIDYNFLHSLSIFQHLEKLHLEGPGFSFDPHRGPIDLIFKHVKFLCINCPFDEILKLLSVSKFPSVLRFFYDIVLPLRLPTSYNYDWVKFFDLLHEVTAPSQIHSIVIEPWRRGWAKNDRQVYAFKCSYFGMPFEVLAGPLLRFKLGYFLVSFPIFRTLSMDHLQAIAKAWPEVTAMHLHSASSDTVGPEALQFIAEKFPFLINLALSINADADFLHVNPSTAFDHTLELLTLRFVTYPDTLSDLSDFASHVDALFPRVRICHEMDAEWHLMDTDEEELPGFLQLLYVIKNARKRERRLQGAPEIQWFFGQRIVLPM